MSGKSDRHKALRAAITAIEKQFGKGAIQTLGDVGAHTRVPVIGSGSLSLDIALGTGGYPRGRLVEIYGPESSGKTTLALHAIAQAQRVGGTAAFIDAEHALDVTYAEALGVDCSTLLVSQPDCGEQALEMCDMLVGSGGIDVVVIDSVAALVPRAEIEADMGDQHVGLQARLMGQAMRKLTRATHQGESVVIFINQLRHKIGVTFGSPETTTGGNALKFFATVRIDVRRIGAIKDGDEFAGNRTRVKVVKNKLAPPFRQVELDVIYGRGIDATADLLELAVAAGLVDKSGAWYSLDGERIGQGKGRVRDWLVEHSQIREGLESKLRAAAGIAAADHPEQEAA